MNTANTQLSQLPIQHCQKRLTLHRFTDEICRAEGEGEFFVRQDRTDDDGDCVGLGMRP